MGADLGDPKGTAETLRNLGAREPKAPAFAVGAIVARPGSSFPHVTFRIVHVMHDSMGEPVYTIDFAEGAKSSDGRGFLAWESDLCPVEVR
jgi:hypothetical protein